MSAPYIKMPDAVVLDESNYTNTFGRFTLQPLERGYGVTLGNSLRRVLLSSLPLLNLAVSFMSSPQLKE